MDNLTRLFAFFVIPLVSFSVSVLLRFVVLQNIDEFNLDIIGCFGIVRDRGEYVLHLLITYT